MRQSSGLMFLPLAVTWVCLFAYTSVGQSIGADKKGLNSAFADRPFQQEYAVRFYPSEQQQPIQLKSVVQNRDGQITILTDRGRFVPENGSMFYDGSFTEEIAYPQMLPKKIRAIGTYHDQTLYLDDKQLFSNGWAGKLQINHGLPGATLFAGGENFEFLISDGSQYRLLDQTGKVLFSGQFADTRQLAYDSKNKAFLFVSPDCVARWLPGQQPEKLYCGTDITTAAADSNGKVVIGTHQGVVILPDKTLITGLPCQDILTISYLRSNWWLGTSKGLIQMDKPGSYRYYRGGRWLTDDRVTALSEGPEQSLLVLTEKGLTQICSRSMTLAEKAQFFEKQVREKNIRYGFNCSSVRLEKSYASGQTGAQPSDNLWTSMYLASQLYRFKATGSAEARENAMEAFEAMERLFTVTRIPGLFARSFERDYIVDTIREAGWEEKELLSGSPKSMWLPAADHPNWTWRCTASSDQTVGQIFALTTVLELADTREWKERALTCLDNLVGYIVKNDLYLIDVDGHPTLWGKWNPKYVNAFPVCVDDRRLNSSNIIAFLQAAYHFTGKEHYRQKANELMNQYGYLENLTRPMNRIGRSDADPLSKILSEEWNHSDDEMYFLAYPSLYKYAFTPELQSKYKAAIADHWALEKGEGN
ncbi:MAG: hypothetical protein LWW85_05490, partial [Marinilabiliales bacterium]|nr:hypothetical protein [Marinilabiliales bacterium]